METRTILSASTGSKIPVNKEMSEKLGVKPLLLMGKPVTNGNGEVILNDQWIYVYMPGYGSKAINVNRAKYCQKMYESEITIQSAIGNKLMDSDLTKFVNQVSDKLVFEKYGRWYRIFLYKKSNRTFGIQKIIPYIWTVDQNRIFDHYYVHELAIDWKRKFYVK
jgi:hypothetical protein